LQGCKSRAAGPPNLGHVRLRRLRL
jgi:hypothetical protein